MGDFEAGTLVLVESSLKYHPCIVRYLTVIRYPDSEHCLVGSLTGAVSSKNVTEEPKGHLSTVGNRAQSVNA